jgi:cation-transporting ATPase 13A1
MESQLVFAGFIAYECKVRTDSPMVVQALRDSGHGVTMLTGDGLLTSLHVAKHVGLCVTAETYPSMTLTVGPHNTFYWLRHQEGHADQHVPIDMAADSTAFGIPALVTGADLVTTEAAFLALAEQTGGVKSPLWRQTAHFRVFARCSPRGKATLIKALMDSGGVCFMCGDGGNDVGALKQADVGLALLAGHSNANTTDEFADEQGVIASASAEDVLNAHDKVIQQRNADYQAKHQAHMKTFSAKLQAQMKQELAAKIQVCVCVCVCMCVCVCVCVCL